LCFSHQIVVFVKCRWHQFQSILILFTWTTTTIYVLHDVSSGQLLLARLLGQHCFARCRLSASSVVVCNARGRSAAAGPGAWPVRTWSGGGRHCKAGTYGYVPLGRHRVTCTLTTNLTKTTTTNKDINKEYGSSWLIGSSSYSKNTYYHFQCIGWCWLVWWQRSKYTECSRYLFIALLKSGSKVSASQMVQNI